MSGLKRRIALSNNNKWVVDWGNLQSGIIYNNEFDTEEEAIEWGKEKNKEHTFVAPMSTGASLTLPITYMHMVYEPMILEDDAPPHQNLDEKDDTPAQDKIEVADDTAAQGEIENLISEGENND